MQLTSDLTNHVNMKTRHPLTTCDRYLHSRTINIRDHRFSGHNNRFRLAVDTDTDIPAGRPSPVADCGGARGAARWTIPTGELTTARVQVRMTPDPKPELQRRATEQGFPSTPTCAGWYLMIG